jgi:hypothetical protein
MTDAMQRRSVRRRGRLSTLAKSALLAVVAVLLLPYGS